MKIRVQLSCSQRDEVMAVMAVMGETKSRVEAQRCRIALLLAEGHSVQAVE